MSEYIFEHATNYFELCDNFLNAWTIIFNLEYFFNMWILLQYRDFVCKMYEQFLTCGLAALQDFGRRLSTNVSSGSSYLDSFYRYEIAAGRTGQSGVMVWRPNDLSSILVRDEFPEIL